MWGPLLGLTLALVILEMGLSRLWSRPGIAAGREIQDWHARR
jgi:hypothetical protein